MKKNTFIAILFAVLLLCITPNIEVNAQTSASNELDAVALSENLNTVGFEVSPFLAADYCEHNIVIDWGMEPTCFNNGLTEGAHCSICGEVLVEQEVILAIGHTFIAATCTEPAFCMRCGLIEGESLGHAMVGATCTEPASCLNCDYTEGEALGHDVVIDEAVAPTCAVSGLTEGAHCDRCGEILVEQEEVFWCLPHNMAEATCTEPSYCIDCGLIGGEALGHDMAEATCTEPATCTRCGLTEGVAYGHSPIIDEGVAPTCTGNGLTMGAHCDRCSEILVEQEEIAALGHDMQDATCTKAKTCARNGCGYSIGNALGHNIVVDEKSDPTCTKEGLTQGAHCDRCGEVFVAQEVVAPALGHDVVVDAKVEPTCTETGLTEGSHCDRCDAVLVAQEEIPALGHNPIVYEYEAPTCLETGLTAGAHCNRCEAVLIPQEEISALGHDIADATCTKPTHCTRCDYTEGEALGHIEIVDAKVEPTCTETGLTEGLHCDRCGEILVAQEEISANGHNFGEWEETKAPTETERGEKQRTCDCGETEIEVIPAIGEENSEESDAEDIVVGCLGSISPSGMIGFAFLSVLSIAIKKRRDKNIA